MTVTSKAKHLISFALLIFLALAGGAAEQPVRAEPVVLRSALLELNPDSPAQTRIGGLTYLGGLIIAGEDAEFGGYSGLVVDGDGAGLWAISDLGHWLRLDFQRDATGLPTGLAAAQILPLRDARGDPITRKVLSDAESLRRLPDGRWLVSFERAHRLWFYDEPGGAATGALSVPAGVAQQPENGGIEAVAVFRNGDLLLFSEEMPAAKNAGEAGSAAWLWRAGAWHDLAWPARDDFKPTDAVALDSAADGDGSDVIVLERYFTPVVGPKARLQRIPAASIRGGGQLQPQLLAEWARPVSVDNMEALDLRRAADGSLWLYVMSDDNRNPLQRTLLMVFRLAP
jgi:hypothetical protein